MPRLTRLGARYSFERATHSALYRAASPTVDLTHPSAKAGTATASRGKLRFRLDSELTQQATREKGQTLVPEERCNIQND